MDWTTPLKFQQADFIKRLNQNPAKLLQSDTQGLHSEIVAIASDCLPQVRAASRKMVPKVEQSAPVGDILLDRLRHEIGVEAIGLCLDGVVTKLSPENRQDPNGTLDFTSRANPAIGLRVKVVSGSVDPVAWQLIDRDVKRATVVVFVWILEPVNEQREDYRAIVAGFLPSQSIDFRESRASVQLHQLLYAGGLAAYLESVKSPPISPEWLRILTGSSGYVYPVAISADGCNIASGSYDGTIKLWKLHDRSISQSLQGHSWSFYPVAGGQSGQALASGSTEKKLNLLEKGTGEFVRTLSGHTSGVSAVAIAENGKILVSGGYDGSINIWSLDRGELLKEIAAHAGTVRPIAIGPDTTTIASGGIDKKLNLWNIETGQLIRSFAIDTDSAISLAISPNGQLLVSGSQDGMVKIWSLETGNLIRAIAAHSGIVRAVAIGDDGETLASGSMERTIKLWNIDSGDLLRTLTGHPDPTIAFAVNSEGPTLDVSLLRHPQPGWQDPRQW